MDNNTLLTDKTDSPGMARPLAAFGVILLALVAWAMLTSPHAAAQQEAPAAEAPAAAPLVPEPTEVPALKNIFGARTWELGMFTVDAEQDLVVVNVQLLNEHLATPLEDAGPTLPVTLDKLTAAPWKKDDTRVPPHQALVLHGLVNDTVPVELWVRYSSGMGNVEEGVKPGKLNSIDYKTVVVDPETGDRGLVEGKASNGIEAAVAFAMIFTVVGGLGIFMLGMGHMSEGLQTIAGNRLRRLISLVTSNRLLAVGIGTLVTCIIQSSSVTTVMVVGFVNSGFMTLTQAIGVIMGANIGTTITGWILVLAIGKYGLPILGLAALVYRFSKRERLRYVAMTAMGVGMIFFGLELMKDGFKPMRDMPAFENMFMAFQATSYFGVLKCAAVGCILTMIVQSSSATLGITIALATQGVIPFETAAALVLGENIGTTITAYLASIGTTTNAKRAAYAHCVFNIIGVLWITAIFSAYIPIIRHLLPHEVPTLEALRNPGAMADQYGAHMTAAIAMVHSVFNVTNTIIFLPFVGHLARLLERIVPDKVHKEAPHLTGLDIRVLETPVIGIEQSRVEILRMGECLEKMMDKMHTITASDVVDDELVRKLFHREEVLDIMQKEVVIFLSELLGDNLPHDVVNEGRLQLRMADEYESCGDYVANVLKLRLRLLEAGLEFSDEGKAGLVELHGEVADYVKMVNQAYRDRHGDIISKAHTQGDAITHHVRDLREKHLARVTSQSIAPLASVIYTDTLSAYRRVKDHMLNVAEALAGQK